MGDEIYHDINNSFIKNQHLLIYTLVIKSSFLVELRYGTFDWIIFGILLVPDNLFIWKWIEYFQIRFHMYYLMMTIRMK